MLSKVLPIAPEVRGRLSKHLLKHLLHSPVLCQCEDDLLVAWGCLRKYGTQSTCCQAVLLNRQCEKISLGVFIVLIIG